MLKYVGFQEEKFYSAYFNCEMSCLLFLLKKDTQCLQILKISIGSQNCLFYQHFLKVQIG